MMSSGHSLMMVFVIAAVTAGIRFLPFVVFRKKVPEMILFLGHVLPYAIMGMLVVYCLKGMSLFGETHGIPEIVSVTEVVLVHRWKHNTLISILTGTLLYMFLIQMVF